MAKVYKLIAHFAWGGLGGREWREGFELAWGEGGIDMPATNEDDLVPTDFVITQEAIDPFITFFRLIHLTTVYLDRITVSTWLPDTLDTPGDPESYDATEVKVFPVGQFCERPIAPLAKVEDLEWTLFVRRIVPSGRLGRYNPRGVLHTLDRDTNSQGKAILAPDSDLAPGGERWELAEAALGPYLSPDTSEEGLRIVIYGTASDGTGDGNMRNVSALIPAGIKSVNLTKRNKAPDEDALLAKAAKIAAKKQAKKEAARRA